MKIIAYTALHYGASYLGYAIRSIIDHVDEYYVLYTPEGSHGHRTQHQCPDTREQLREIVRDAAGDKARWYDVNYTHEGQHRDAIHEIVTDADVVLVLDSDEVWGEGIAKYLVSLAELAQCKRYRVPIVHYWRSFRRCVLHDPAFPIRIIFPNLEESTNTAALPKGMQPINHFGYAIRPELMMYKMRTHGHKNEFRTDVDWYKDVFLANAQEDCHPVGSEHWNPEDVNPLDYMPGWMQQHPYYKMEVIE